MRCMITANRRARATIAFFIPRRLAICMAQALSRTISSNAACSAQLRRASSASSHRHSAIFCRSNRSRLIDTWSTSAQTPPRLTWISGKRAGTSTCGAAPDHEVRNDEDSGSNSTCRRCTAYGSAWSSSVPAPPAPTGVAVRSTAPPRRRSPAPWSRSTCRSRLGMFDMESMSNTTRYGVLIDGRRGGYGVVFPDLPGCY